MMTKQATLGPIDPSIMTPLNPQIPGAGPAAKVPVSVESINGYIEFAKKTLGPEADLTTIFLHLSNNVHPLVLGGAFRARAQIRMLASRLMALNHSKEKVDKILEFLCSESGSHDYTINRREAKNELMLPIKKPTLSQYKLIKKIYDDIEGELELGAPYDPNAFLGTENAKEYDFHRAIIESLAGGCHLFQSQGVFIRQPPAQPNSTQKTISDERKFEGWRHVHE
jgi:hypothetical protein